jgi:hypothetical protein
MFNNAKSAPNATLWYFTTNTVRTFISSVALTNPTGSGAAEQIMQQMTLTFRCALGGIIKLVILEPNLPGNTIGALVANAAGTTPQRLAAHVMSASGVVVGIDNSFPITPLNQAFGQNESLFKLLNR